MPWRVYRSDRRGRLGSLLGAWPRNIRAVSERVLSSPTSSAPWDDTPLTRENTFVMIGEQKANESKSH